MYEGRVGLMKNSLEILLMAKYKVVLFRFTNLNLEALIVDLIKRWHWHEETMQETTHVWTYIINAWHMRVVGEGRKKSRVGLKWQTHVAWYDTFNERQPKCHFSWIEIKWCDKFEKENKKRFKEHVEFWVLVFNRR